MHRAIVEQRLSKQLSKIVRDVSDEKLPGAVALVAYTSSWSFLDQSVKDKVIEFVRTGPEDEIVEWLYSLSEIEELKSEVQTRADTLSFEGLTKAIESHRLATVDATIW